MLMDYGKFWQAVFYQVGLVYTSEYPINGVFGKLASDTNIVSLLVSEKMQKMRGLFIYSNTCNKANLLNRLLSTASLMGISNLNGNP